MGGSSLAPEVMSLVFGHALSRDSEKIDEAGGGFAILDSTDPAQVAETEARFPLEQTMFIVSSKSGGTAEVSAMFDYFWAKAAKAFGDQAGKHFIAITDPGTALEKLAKERGFARVFSANPLVGGRYSALTHFGLVPAALMGLDLDQFLARARWMSAQCQPQLAAERNPGLVLGALIGQAVLNDRDKLTIVADSGLESIGSWLEQLIAESTGKLGKGVVPVDLEPLGNPSDYGSDRLFVYLRKAGEHDSALEALQAAGQPMVVFDLAHPYDLAAEFYRWEFATAVTCAVLAVNAFDQPDVQDAKDRTKSKIAEYKATGAVSPGTFVSVEQARAALQAFLATANAGDYIALNAYLRRNRAMEQALTELRAKIRAQTGCATTVGFGPRFLHSTGQLHKGGADNGLFLQITADAAADFEIPGQGMTFGTLERAQALGDFEALAARRRRILRIHLTRGAALKDLLAQL